MKSKTFLLTVTMEVPQTRQENGPTCEVQDQLTQVGCNLLELLCQKATQAQFATPLNKHQMDQLRKSAVPEKTRAQTEWV